MNGVISTPLQFGIGDGTTTAFELASNPGEQIAQIVIANIFRTDWQGNQQLYPAARTNKFLRSTNLLAAAWSGTRVASLVSAAGPDGSTNAATLTANATGSAYLYQGFTDFVANQPYELSVFAKPGSGTSIALTSFTQVGQCLFTLSGAGTAAAPTGIASKPTISPVGGGWYRCSIVITPTASGFNNVTATSVVTANTSVTFFGPQIGPLASGVSAPTSYIPTTTAAATVTDFAFTDVATISVSPAPLAAAVLSWTGTYVYTPVDLPSNFPLSTVISQYANSPTLLQLIENFGQYIDPSADIDAFYDMVWNIDSAVGRGLDIWGKIVGLESGRLLKIPSAEINLGFKEAGNASATPFGSGVFYSGSTVTENYYLADSAFRTLILVKAMANISDGSIPSYNQLLQNLFKGRGRCYVNDLGNMQMRYTFEFYLQPFEIAILTQSGAMPRPTGVLATIMQVPVPNIFGFSEAGKTSVAPFGQGTLFTGVLNAS
ncbi:DUF2612 domain-containing protein [Burkholderia territorii]|uniref:DUF2612 domain-containing protein n=1 Tax=Burkholderia territorii TaxID=1503055 RepID=UPI0009C018F3|nr:DUF2612 domain-containing protein [Burkholderia territorii]